MITELDGNYILTKNLLPEDLTAIMEIAREALEDRDCREWVAGALDIGDTHCDRLLLQLTEILNGCD